MDKSKIFSLLLATALAFSALAFSGGASSEPDEPDVPVVPEPEPEPAPEVPDKPVVLWIDAEANFARFRAKPDIRHYQPEYQWIMRWDLWKRQETLQKPDSRRHLQRLMC